MSSDNHDTFDNPNKQYVREKHWEPCFQTLKNEIDSWKYQRRALRYLCFPGKNLIFIKTLLKKKLINSKSFLVAIEKDEIKEIDIRIALSRLFNRDNIIIYNDLFEKLIISSNEFCNKFPFDILGMDLTKCVLKTLRDSLRAPILGDLENLFINQQKALNQNLFRINKFYLIITSNMDILASKSELEKYKGDKTKYLIETILREFAKLLNHSYLNELVNKTAFNQKETDKVIVIGITLSIISLASNYFNIELNDYPICYKGTKNGAKMVGLIFLCKKKKLQIGSSVLYNKLKLKNLKESVDKSEETIFLPEPES